MASVIQKHPYLGYLIGWCWVKCVWKDHVPGNETYFYERVHATEEQIMTLEESQLRKLWWSNFYYGSCFIGNILPIIKRSIDLLFEINNKNKNRYKNQ